MIGFYNYTVIMTYVSLLISSAGLYFAVNDRPYIALFCLLSSGICDMFDGKIARTRKKSSDEERSFGIQLDSLCDLVCFGVLPAVIGGVIAKEYGAPHIVSWILGAALILCALIRLAYFNVTEETRQKTEGGRRTHFEGLPVTSSAVIFPFAFGMAMLMPAALKPWIYPAFMAATAVCFVSPIRVPKPRLVGLIVLGLIGLAEFGILFWMLITGA